MSKKKQKKTGKQVAPKKSTTKKVPSTSKTASSTPAPILPITSELDPLYRRIFFGLNIAIFVLLAIMALNSGINGDDEFQNDYSEKLVQYYLTFGEDKAALHIEKGNMHNYGGFFDLTTGLVNTALGLEDYDASYHSVRHFFNAIFGILAILFVGLLTKEIAGWRAGILAVLFLFLSPRFLGHSLMNPKDIPFAAGFAIALYYMVLLFRQMPQPKWQHALGVTLGVALALATRAGGLLLIAYLFLFAGLDYLFKHGLKNLVNQTKLIGIYAIWTVSISIAGYILAILSWPAALENPLQHPFDALTEFSQLGIKIRLLFMGENIMSDDTAWFYSILWIAKTIPLFVLIGFLGSLIFTPQLVKKYGPLAISLILFASIFPVAYVIYKDSILHDGWRHLQFVYPSMVASAALFWIFLETMFQKNKVLTYVVWGVLGLMALESTVFIIRNPHLPYVYFNPLGGGVKGALGEFETDYWGVGVKQALEWMEDENILSDNMTDTVFLGTTFFYNVSRQANKKYDKVRTRYVRYYQRYSQDWDYGIFPSRFVRGPHLRSGNWPNSKTIHTVTANGVPMVAVIKNEGKHSFKAAEAIKNRDWATAVSELQQELAAHPDNELAWLDLANAHLNMGNNQEALNAAEEALKVAPDFVNGLYFKGLAQLRLGDSTNGLLSFERAVAINEEFTTGYYYIALVHEQSNRPQEALENIQKLLQINQRFKPAYELAIRLFEKAGDTQNANRYREVLSKL